jgi:hypothetical protein
LSHYSGMQMRYQTLRNLFVILRTVIKLNPKARRVPKHMMLSHLGGWCCCLPRGVHPDVATVEKARVHGAISVSTTHPQCLNELAGHKKEYKLFEAAHQPRHSLSSLLNTASDGWVPREDWGGTESAHREVFEEMLQEVLGNEQPHDGEPIRGEIDLRDIWPFDLEE